MNDFGLRIDATIGRFRAIKPVQLDVFPGTESRGQAATVRNNLLQYDVWNYDIPLLASWTPISQREYQEQSAPIEIELELQMGDWWQVTVLIAAVVIGAALLLYVGMEWTAGAV